MIGGSGLSIGLAFAGGVVSFLSPCVLPLVPSYLSFVTGMTLADPRVPTHPSDAADLSRNAAVHAALFVAGFSLVFVALGATATVLGVAVRRALPTVQVVGGMVIVAFGLHMVGILRIPALMREHRAHLASRPAGLVGSVIVGIAFAAGWTPCIGPILASILLYAGVTATVGHGIALLSAYTLGLGIPFLLAAVGLNWYLGHAARLRPWLNVVERLSGSILIVMGAMLATGQFTMISRFFARFGQLVTLE